MSDQMELPSLDWDVRDLKPQYRSGEDDLRADFFQPCLVACTRYRRGAGYFSSSVLASWGETLSSVVRMESGSIQLLISPILRDDDRAALATAVGPERTALRRQCGDSLVLRATGVSADSGFDGSTILAWLVAKEIVEIRFAFPSHSSEPGIYHEKIGVLDFPQGDRVAFTGSANESSPGHSANYESLDVFRSWVEGDIERVAAKAEQFDEAWQGSAAGLEVIALSEEALERVRTYASKAWPPQESDKEDQEDPRWRHQDDAVDAFMRERRGVLEMATGTGKTRTALRIMRELLERESVDSVIVTADGTDLLDQWHRELLSIATSIDPPMAVLRHYSTHHDTDRFVQNPRHSILLVSRPRVHLALRAHGSPEHLLLVHDEVHRLGSPGNRKLLSGLSDRVNWRLGLSATPEREYDEEGTEFIADHVGPVIYEFDLAQAIQRRVLCPFQYEVIGYEPSQDDRDRIANVYKMRAARAREGRPMTDPEFWTELAKVHKTSVAKVEPFEQFIRGRPELLTRCIIFVETKEYGQRILPLIHSVHPNFHTYFDQDDKAVLRRFASGDLECLLTCHRLSEGIDVRSLRNVVLFSSARARLETIQRIGRCLRWDPEDPSKVATVIDFIRDEGDGKQNADTLREEWLSSLAQLRPGD